MQKSNSWFCSYFFFCRVRCASQFLRIRIVNAILKYEIIITIIVGYIFARLHSTFKWKDSFTQLKHQVPIGRRRFVLSSDGASSIENSCSCMHRHTHTHSRNLLGARARARSKSYATAATTYFNCSIPIQWTRAQIFDDAESAIDCHIYIIIIARTHRHSLRARHTHGGRVSSDGTLTI